jgi:sugar phosphate isomerase/epimerase
MDRLAIEALSVFALPPVEFVGLAADLGCSRITTSLSPFAANPHGYPAWSLRDAAARRELKAVMEGRGVTLSLGEGLVVAPRVDVTDYEADLEALVELGAKRINTMSMDSDRSRTVDQFARLAEMAGAAGVEMMIEFAPVLALSDLSATVAMVREIKRPNVRIMIDTMHLVRSGGSPQELKALDPGLCGYIQLCDVSLIASVPDYTTETMTERMTPGTGQAPLLDILSALPRDLIVGVEVPLLSRAKAGEGPHQRVGECLNAARILLAQL